MYKKKKKKKTNRTVTVDYKKKDHTKRIFSGTKKSLVFRNLKKMKLKEKNQTKLKNFNKKRQ